MARCELGTPVYLTQAIQSLEFPVPLVAGRSALLRAFVFSPFATGQPIPDVRATFYRNDEQVHTVDIEGGKAAIPTEFDESSLAHSANADIPGDVLQPGLEVVIEVDPDGASIPPLGVPQRMPTTGRLAVDVREMPDFQLTLVPFLYEAEPDSSILEITAGMASDPEGHPMFKDTRALLPIGDFDVVLHDPVVTSTDNGFQLLRDTEAIRLMEGRPGYWLAMLAPLPRGGLLGVADGIGSWTSFSFPLSRTIAHEFGHNMNLRHAPCGGAGGPDPLFPDRNGRIGAWGYDRVSGRLFSPYATDLMSYCRGGWISGYHVSNSLIHRLDAETEASEEKTRSVMVWGGRDADGRVFLEPAFVVDAIPKLPPMGGEFQLRGRTDAGGEAFSFSFDMPYIPDVEDGRSSFVYAVPVTWTDALTSISLVGGDASVALDEASYSPLTIVRDPATGQVRAMLREPETAAMDAFGSVRGPAPRGALQPGHPGGTGAATLRDSGTAAIPHIAGSMSTGASGRTSGPIPRKAVQRQDAAHQVRLTRDALLAEDLVEMPADGAFAAPRERGDVAHALPVRHQGRQLALGRGEAQGRLHEPDVDAGLTFRIGDQYEHAHLPRVGFPLVRGQGDDVDDEPSGRRRARDGHRAGRPGSAPRGRRPGQQSLQDPVVPRRRGAQHTVHVGQPFVLLQQAACAIVCLHDPPTPVKLDNAEAAVFINRRHGGCAVEGMTFGERLLHPHI